MPPTFELLTTHGAARRGRLTTAHGVVETPAFMPVGTLGAVKGVTPQSLAQAGASIMLCNLYHLALRPGIETIEQQSAGTSFGTSFGLASSPTPSSAQKQAALANRLEPLRPSRIGWNLSGTAPDYSSRGVTRLAGRPLAEQQSGVLPPRIGWHL